MSLELVEFFEMQSQTIKIKRVNRALSAVYLMTDAISTLVASNNKTHILLACMPKSASTFLATALGELPNIRQASLVPAWGRREQEMSSIQLSHYNQRNYVAQLHLRHSQMTEHYIKKYNLTPIVLVRNLADCAISFRDHLRKTPEAGPLAYFDQSHLEMDDPRLEEAIVSLAIPWYLNFYSGWRAARNVPIYDFDAYTTEPVKVLSEILSRANAKVSETQIQEALEKAQGKPTRFNVGKPGRGRFLSAGAKTALLKQMEFYPRLQDDPLFIKTKSTILAE